MPIKFSIIIPCFNEAAIIADSITQIINAAFKKDEIEIIVVDGGSNDGSMEILKVLPVQLVISEITGRARQMNLGASNAKGNILYFLHADTIPPHQFDTIILDAHDKKIISGCFRLHFDHSHWFLKTNAWFTRFNLDFFRFGDQSLFINKDAFENIGGFNEKNLVFEDQQIIKRIREHYKFRVLKEYVTTSSRMYLKNGIYFTQFYYFYLFSLYKLGLSQNMILKKYKNRLSKN